MSVFISYSRWNKPFADRLKIDLERAGLAVWLDTTAILAGRAWRNEIELGIKAADWVVLLASPESGRSAVVKDEIDYATKLGKPLIPLLIGGTPGLLPPEWQSLHLIDFTRDYWTILPNLLQALSAGLPTPSSTPEHIGRPGVSVRQAAAAVRGERALLVTGRDFVAVPLGPTGYATTWLIGPADEPFRVPDELAWVLHFSGPVSRRVDHEVLEYLTANRHPGWVVSVEGPKNWNSGFLELSDPHVWADGVEIAFRTSEHFLKGRHVRMFMNSPVSLGFAVGGRVRDMFRKYGLYHYTAGAGPSGKPYELVYERGRT